MSRLAKKPIVIPEKVEVVVQNGNVSVTGPLGTLSRSVPGAISLVVKDGGIVVTPNNNALSTKMLVGTTVAHVRNMIKGSTEMFVKKLIIEGIGFKAEVKGSSLQLALGFSHPVTVAIPKELKVVSEKGLLSISGGNIETVGAFAARVRALKKPEPYKGKGIRYETEVIRRKQGKKTT
ncbi:MAG: 50S ribosomal protein L6 [Candidatus Taylorbacteria bacterium RIFCSPHIGHO2_01_FULL_51_15]|uniref:50S ribosomal protein L6 n=1 Tax=Candidatus Taylorbacteria bacterium RIFCSPHIGHO2_01_FULL_51_15 TaxID=1802304 RepID=A0A1G2MC69_9BACT|nr:MAG: 50S ribosomal protein L6 [Candidatus Taylorbacteria bacterium RIFCSPHIGHO2_01_FULL_51_15]